MTWLEVMNLVFRGVPFQKTTASVPKLLPLIVMVKGTLLTGTLSGVNVIYRGRRKDDGFEWITSVFDSIAASDGE